MTTPTDNILFLSAPVNALIEGLYESPVTVQEVLKHGDFGLGTFNNLDGEMVVLDGTVYQIRDDGRVHVVSPEEHSPFACVTFFHAETWDEVRGDFPWPAFRNLLERVIPSPNMAYALRIEGTFPHARTRSVPRQDNYRPLVEVTRDQPEFEMENITGTLAGFYTPPFMASLNVPGFHLHLLTEDRARGGHLIEAHMSNGRIGVQHIPRLEMDLPMTFDYMTADFRRDTASDLNNAEH